jgi:O-antigen/teichoic acid export membrane protein
MNPLEPPTNINRSVMSGLKWVTISRMAAQLLTWANTFLVIRLLSPTDYGLATLAGLFANYLSLLNELGFSVTLVQRQTRDEESLRHVFGALLAFGAMLTVGLMLAAPLLGSLTREPRIVPLIRFVALQFLTMSFGIIPLARLSMDMRFRELSIVELVASLVGAATTLVMALNGAGAWSLIVGTVVITVARTILLNFKCPVLRIPRLQLSRLSDFAGFSGLVVLQTTLWYWYVQIDSFVVGRALGAEDLGIYAVGRQVTNIPLERAMGIINSVALPAFSLVKGDPDRVRRGYLKILRLGAGYAFPVFWGLAIVSEPAIRLVIGVKWIASVTLIQLLCISMPLRMLNALTGSAVTAVARQDVNIKSLLLAIAVIPTCIVVGSRWGVVGVAVAWAIGFPFVYLFNAALVRRALRIPISDMLAAVWPPALGAAVMVAFIWALSVQWMNSLPYSFHLATAIPLGAAIYIGTLWLVSRRSVREMLDFAKGVVAHNP